MSELRWIMMPTGAGTGETRATWIGVLTPAANQLGAALCCCVGALTDPGPGTVPDSALERPGIGRAFDGRPLRSDPISPVTPTLIGW